MIRTLPLGKPGQLFRPVKADLPGGKLSGDFGRLPETRTGPAHTPRRLMRDIGPGAT
jgi:hypothetical protein